MPIWGKIKVLGTLIGVGDWCKNNNKIQRILLGFIHSSLMHGHYDNKELLLKSFLIWVMRTPLKKVTKRGEEKDDW